MSTNKFADQAPALEYIRERGYASFSSLKMFRDAEIPTKSDAAYFIFGTELHSRFLENKKVATLSDEEEATLATMLAALRKHPVVAKLMEGARVEVQFETLLQGVKVIGRIDILKPKAISDLKTTRHSALPSFAASMDFLQAALYLAATGAKSFYYIGICKQPPYKVFVFSTDQYPDRMKEAKEELKRLLKQLRASL